MSIISDVGGSSVTVSLPTSTGRWVRVWHDVVWGCRGCHICFTHVLYATIRRYVLLSLPRSPNHFLLLPHIPQGGSLSISALVQQLNSNSEAPEAIASRDRLTCSANDPCTLAKIVALLGADNTASMQDQAAGALWCLSLNDGNKARIAAAGAIPPLVALLGTQNTVAAVQEKAAGAFDEPCHE